MSEPTKRRPMRPVTQETHDQVRALHAEGHGRNEIARRIDRSPRTVSEIAEELGLDFDRTHTAVATEARKVDAKARRAALIDRAYTRAERIYARLEAEDDAGFKFTATTAQGIQTATLDHVPGSEEKALGSAAGVHLTQAAKLEALDSDNGTDAARSMLGALADGIRSLTGQPDEPAED